MNRIRSVKLWQPPPGPTSPVWDVGARWRYHLVLQRVTHPGTARTGSDAQFSGFANCRDKEKANSPYPSPLAKFAPSLGGDSLWVAEVKILSKALERKYI